MIRRFLSVILIMICAFSVFSFFGCDNNGTENNSGGYEYSFYLNKDNVVIEKGETFNLIATYGNNSISFKSCDESIASVDKNGTITAKNLGTTYVIVFSCGKERICEIKVVSYEYIITLNKTGTLYAYNDNFTVIELNARTERNGEVYSDTVDWSVNGGNCLLSTNENTATFSPREVGEFIITASSSKGATTSVTIIVLAESAVS